MSRRLLAVTLAVAAGAVLTGCAQSPNGRPTEPGQAAPSTAAPVTVTATVTTTAAPDPYVPDGGRNWRIPVPTTTAPEPEPQYATFTDDEIREQTALAVEEANSYWWQVFDAWHDDAGNPVSWQTPQLLHGDGFYDSIRNTSSNACGVLPAMNASFCGSVASGTGTLSWDMELFREKTPKGDAPIFATVAHEVGHAAQMRFRHDGEGLATPPGGDKVHLEQQADCLGGAALGKMVADGYLTIYDGFEEEIVTLIMSFEEGDGDHGSNPDRVHAFRHGYDSTDVESCLYNRGVPPRGLFV